MCTINIIPIFIFGSTIVLFCCDIIVKKITIKLIQNRLLASFVDYRYAMVFNISYSVSMNNSLKFQ